MMHGMDGGGWLATVAQAATSELAWLDLVYLLAAALFIFGLKMLSSVKTARRGNLVSALGMLVAAGATLFYLTGGTAVSLIWVAVSLLIGTVVGLVIALRIPMTGMPQMVALLNGFGGSASLLVAAGDFARHTASSTRAPYQLAAVGLAVLIGGATFTGSLVAFGKLQGLRITPSRPVQFLGQKVVIVLLLMVALVLTVLLAVGGGSDAATGVVVIAVASLLLGILLVIGIGGADMPVVISLLNSYSGLAASMAGFVLKNNALIITGALVGASGIILTNIMCKAMNRSLLNVLFGGVGGTGGGAGAAGSKAQGTARELTAEDVAIQLDAAGLVIVVPGYGMAVAQAQHAVKELADNLEDRGIDVKYAIHPVAGRMPGHMNVLLAEAGVDYDQLCDLETINPEFEQASVALVIGANDVTNPAARHAEDSPIYGMPILDVDKARSVVVVKRSLNPGFAGVENELYFKPNCGMLFGDAKSVVNALVGEMKDG